MNRLLILHWLVGGQSLHAGIEKCVADWHFWNLVHSRKQRLWKVERKCKASRTVFRPLPPISLFSMLSLTEISASWSHVFNGVIGCGSFIWSISAIELIISWNKITGVHNIDTTGQYIPLVIGICSLVTVLYELIKDHFVSLLSFLPGLSSILSCKY